MFKLSPFGRGPAIMDGLQGLSGALLALFLLLHLHLEASILIGPEAFDAVAWFLHAGWADPAGHGYAAMVVAASLVILTLLALHVWTALRRVPIQFRQWRALSRHLHWVHHSGTRWWLVQLVTGMALMIFLPVHLITMMTQPHQISVELSALRIVNEGGWLLYGVLLPLAVLHGVIGLARLALKWLPSFTGRQGLRRITAVVVVYLLVLGGVSLAAHIDNGQRLNDGQSLSVQSR
ncbi:Fumarate reductase respiratory complex [Ferrimonas balearica DSM 9799]|uniref:Fumarate reductase respiratory complex n=1 Tax=Ferrimonas balearica (strain DSM 9799 / CCM 4581 / KCTC 23876 / PAT) TaxID=550540 RepID=E1SP21_FERBD|nr:fumarate reductase respiratory complex [Ferrimonas balearica]ADN74670.1 Fumarate reductase respiratory complex [Ferrimonas balearica DSM 9799]MBW3140468.1 succinate dehydrogenase/fumarate reductase cytochrome b subunit [Ferrimonas balearica]MBW3165544.1 succinate dehydrogenase/fumarate reductase cytochrome b subunit [Ferrimonas balearica]MBY5981242.1 succinate dehydrogenase/fumarate reductase cytochrome b subunit [Ferrimonas balearica]MBY6107722.1 succinate dehydrogenase/fumarate reductase 